MKTPLTARIFAAAFSIVITVSIFSAVISIAEKPQPDGTVRLAHTVLHAPTGPAPTLVAQAPTNALR